MSYTPGPWKVKTTDYAGRYVLFNDIVRGRVPKDFGDEDEANARLIAAAPDLLEALKDTRDCLAAHGYCSRWEREVLRLAGTAISKAEGAATPGRHEATESLEH
jgi:hypothetical protein